MGEIPERGSGGASGGRVSLVGAGPGDPGLLTRRGAELLARADAVVHDRLAHPELVDLAPAGAERIYVGKTGGKPSVSQEEIHRILLELVGRGLHVVRLKGGDPFVFGRGGEEALLLREHGIPFEVVPGVTAGVAAAAYAGIPVTHRAVAVGVSFFTGHEDPTKETSQLHLEGLGAPGTTGVFYMGRRNLPLLVERILGHGRDPATPAAMISWATHPHQRTLVSTLGSLVEDADRTGIEPPCITVVGEVVALREKLDWFESRPLFGRTVAVTRARAQASAFGHRLRELGARVLETPAIEIVPPEDPGPLIAALGRLESYPLVIFTSPNAVRRVFEEISELGGDARRFGASRLCAIGPGTAAALAARGLVADVVPARFQAEGVLEALEDEDLDGARVLLPRAREARAVLPDTLRARGAEVEVVEAYRTVPVEPVPEVLATFERGEVDLVTFTSSSTVRNFHAHVGSRVEARFRTACIGPITADTARELGYTVDVLAGESTIDGLVGAIRDAFAGADGA